MKPRRRRQTQREALTFHLNLGVPPGVVGASVHPQSAGQKHGRTCHSSQSPAIVSTGEPPYKKSAGSMATRTGSFKWPGKLPCASFERKRLTASRCTPRVWLDEVPARAAKSSLHFPQRSLLGARILCENFIDQPTIYTTESAKCNIMGKCGE